MQKKIIWKRRRSLIIQIKSQRLSRKTWKIERKWKEITNKVSLSWVTQIKNVKKSLEIQKRSKKGIKKHERGSQRRSKKIIRWKEHFD